MLSTPIDTRFRPIDDHEPILVFVCALLLTNHTCLVSSRPLARSHSRPLITYLLAAASIQHSACISSDPPLAVLFNRPIMRIPVLDGGNTDPPHQWNEQPSIILSPLTISLFVSRYISCIDTHPSSSFKYVLRSNFAWTDIIPIRHIDHA